MYVLPAVPLVFLHKHSSRESLIEVGMGRAVVARPPHRCEPSSSILVAATMVVVSISALRRVHRSSNGRGPHDFNALEASYQIISYHDVDNLVRSLCCLGGVLAHHRVLYQTVWLARCSTASFMYHLLPLTLVGPS